jgi:GT2 family glycosyltransferase
VPRCSIWWIIRFTATNDFGFGIFDNPKSKMLAVLIVNWNVRDLLRACLLSLQAHPATTHAQHIFVVDNASSDGSVDMLRAEFPDVQVIANATNRGFTGGNNDGLKAIGNEEWGMRNDLHSPFPTPHSAFDYVLLLNPDTEVTAGALDAMLAYADAHDHVAIVGPQLRYGDGTLQSSRRRFPTLATTLFESTWLQKYSPRSVSRAYYASDLPLDRPCEVDWVVGAAMLARWKAVQQVGGLDEQNFFMYSEEVDWCKRMKDAGWRVVWLPLPVVIHHEGKSSGQVSTRRMQYFNTSKVRYLRKHHGARQAGIARWGLLALLRWEWLIEGIKRALGHQPAMRAERMKAFSEVIRTGLK